MPERRRFCVLTTGRAGSTALMDALARFEDVAVPSKEFECRDNELVHPGRIAASCREFSSLIGKPIAGAEELIECFFERPRSQAFAGFKSMPNRHRNFDEFVQRKDIRFITLIRTDLASTLASFMVADAHPTWRRQGGESNVAWEFRREDVPVAVSRLSYLLQCLSLIERVPNPVRLTYEELCRPDFRNLALDDFFARPISIENPKPPTDARQYVSNWSQFVKFISGAIQSLREQGRLAASTCQQSGGT